MILVSYVLAPMNADSPMTIRKRRDVIQLTVEEAETLIKDLIETVRKYHVYQATMKLKIAVCENQADGLPLLAPRPEAKEKR